MLPSNAIEAEASSPPSRYDKGFLPDESCRFAETEVVARYQEDEVKAKYGRPVYREDSNEKIPVKTGSKFPNDRRSFSKGSSLQSLVRRRSRRHAQSSLPLDADLSAYSLYPEQKQEETCTRTSTLVYSSRGENKDVSSSTNLATTGTGNSVTCSVSGSRINTGSSTRTASVITAAAGPSTSSSWNNSPEEELDYVVDPVHGNAYYKGQLLGKGGFAKVFLMTDVTNGNEYACKIIRKNRMQKIHMQKIAREIMIHKELNHVNVVQLHHYFEDNLNVYMLMEACPRKQSLMHVLKYRGKVTEPEARYYMKQMVTGVAYIHSQRVVHRDLKPGNMFLSEQMIVKVGDFGLATRLDGQCRRVTICGTPNYIAPEVLYKQAYSYEADVWALGCILYALLVGQPPFDTATLKETYARICSNHYREVDGTMASRNGQDLIRWLLQPNPELRPSLEKVKEHPYLTEEYVPESLPRTSCFQVPQTTLVENQVSSPSFDSSASANQKLNNVQVHTLQRSQQDQHRGNVSEKSLRKGPSKVISWLTRKLRKVPKFRQRLSSVLCPDQKKTGYAAQSMQMHRALENCINGIKCKNKLRNHPPVKDLVPLFITKWIDYSNKYGLGFQLSDRSVGILFNDHTKISYTHDRRRVEYVTTEDEVTRFQKEEDVPTALQKKLLLLQRFTQYMDKFMTEGGEIKRHRAPTRNSRNSCVPRMRRWFRTDKTIVMELTVPLLQVNFFEDHTKLVVSQESPNKGYLVTYIDTSRKTSSYWLNDIRDLGCTADLYERLYHVYQVSKEFVEVHDNTIG
ncbi:serine/threonine-protein kinase PLK1-like isoform X1 [Ceratina calcarata]|uniref:Serine/threonine-protein kinase PLK n=1 Tax=Ceratina calcarata TaxID=156304 RepID=A0AAJ7SC73_9HYME|nr:serine/threonine-protein kinase PLK1-like isoform X1 [Ceratina calcarata]